MSVGKLLRQTSAWIIGTYGFDATKLDLPLQRGLKPRGSQLSGSVIAGCPARLEVAYRLVERLEEEVV